MNECIRRDVIVGSRRISNYFWLIALFIGGCGFLIAGLSSYAKTDLLFFIKTSKLIFIPQGIIMMFYGTLAVTLSIFLLLTIIWDIGGGYNEFDKSNNVVRIVRKGFPGKNKQILLVYPIDSINSIKVLVREGLNPRRTIYLNTKDERQIPLTQIDQPKPLALIEKEALELALFLDVNLETY